jgi:hypothetical protein
MRRRVSFIGTHLSGEVDNDEGAEKHGDNNNNSRTRHTTDGKNHIGTTTSATNYR